ncbi:hypothetical protein PsYK624_129390 [Phanerochaete sordida]|uniref:Uncharacterized protein n=1 Tax=Phanerochaete sordida TaxID=48140 RepID=A0A9P3LJ05_9APHY|nr:hypothetical protein PsYK624_129390 [Phanerochaete sordida]
MQARSGPSVHPSFSPPPSDAGTTSLHEQYEHELPELLQASTTYWDSKPAGAKDQTVFLKYYKVKRRPVLPNKIVARAGYHELPRHDDFPPSKLSTSSAVSDSLSVSSEQQPLRLPLAIDDILDYILEHSDAQLAIASDDDILDVLKDRTPPEDVYRWLTDVRPKIDVNAQGVGALAGLSASDELLADSEIPDDIFEPSSEGRSSIPFDDADNPKHISAFFQAHFHSLWDQAVSYAEDQGLYGLRDPDYRHCTALARYQSSSSNAPPGHVECSSEFGPPNFEVRCQHEAELVLNMKRVIFLPAAHPRRLEYDAVPEELRDVQATFAIPFRVSSGFPQECGTSTLVFDLELQRARMVATSSLSEQARDVLEPYLLEYLAFLERAGHGTLFYPLMTSTDLSLASIDFSRSSSELSTVTHVQGVAVEEINRFLAIAWLMASTELYPDGDPAFPLADYRGVWPLGLHEEHIRIDFGPPTVSALCDIEVVFVLRIKGIYFGEEGATNSSTCDWKVALLMNLERSEDADGVSEYRLDRLSSYFMPQFSRLPEAEYRAQIVDFLSGEYLYMLEQTGGLVIFHHDPRTPHLSLGDLAPQSQSAHRQPDAVGGNVLDVDTTLWGEWAQRANMCGFDFVRALTESAINSHFQSLWRKSQMRAGDSCLLVEWQHRDLCRMTFEPLTALLLDDGTSMLRVNVAQGMLKSSQNETSTFNFSNWTIAYKVKLALCDEAALSGLASRSESDHPTEDFMHLYLDLGHAEFDLLHSRFENLGDSGSVDKAQAIVILLRQYLTELASSGIHVLTTVPLSASSPEYHSHGLSSVTFCVSPIQRPYAEGPAPPPVVLILGTYDDRPLPVPTPHEWGQWCSVICSPSLDFLALSANSFLYGQLLPILSEVNAVTRVEPTFSEFQRRVWQLRLTTWSRQPERAPGDCSFAPLPAGSTDGKQRFQWKLGRKFSTTGNDAHSVTCYTDNRLDIQSGPQLELVLYGTIGLELKTRYWSASGRATWKTTIKISFERGELQFSSVESPVAFERATSQGRPYSATPLDPQQLLRDVLPGSVKLPIAADGLERLKTVIAACDTARNDSKVRSSTFNHQGDLLMQIHPSSYDPYPASRARSTSPPAIAQGSVARSLPMYGRQRQLLGVPRNQRDDEDTCSEASPLSSILSPTPISSLQSAYTPSSATSSGFPSAGPKTTFSALRTLPTLHEVDARPASATDNLSPLARQALEIFSIPHSNPASIRASSASPTPSSASSMTKNSGVMGRRRLSPSPPPITIPSQPLWRKAVTSRSRGGSTTSSMGQERQEL